MSGTAKTPEQKETIKAQMTELRAEETQEQREERVEKFKETIKTSSRFGEERSAKISVTRLENSERLSLVAQEACERKSPEARAASLANLALSRTKNIEVKRDADGNILCRCGCGGVVKPLRKNRPQYTIPGHEKNPKT